MVQIYFDCGTLRVEGVDSQVGVEMIFDRYEGQAKARCVFKENPLTTGRKDSGNSDGFERNKSDAWRKGLKRYLRPGVGARAESGRFDLPPYQIRIKTKANDTELPNLEFDVPKREISFEWEGMFDRFYSEGARLEKRAYAIWVADARYLRDDHRSLVGALALKKKHNAPRRINMRAVRRERVKKWHLEKHNFDFEDGLFKPDAEDKALAAIEEFELHGDYIRCAEDTEARKFLKDHAGTQRLLARLNLLREVRGVREDDEEGVQALLTEMSENLESEDECREGCGRASI